MDTLLGWIPRLFGTILSWLSLHFSTFTQCFFHGKAPSNCRCFDSRARYSFSSSRPFPPTGSWHFLSKLYFKSIVWFDNTTLFWPSPDLSPHLWPQTDTLEALGEEISGMARCPYDAKHANVALFAGKVQMHPYTSLWISIFEGDRWCFFCFWFVLALMHVKDLES